MDFFDKFKQGLKKTAQLLNTDIRDLFKGEGRLVDELFLEELFETLVKTDMGVDAAQELVHEVRTNSQSGVVEMDDILKPTKKNLKVFFANPADPIHFASSGPTVIM